MRSRSLLVSALVVVLGAALFLAGMWAGGRRILTHAATTAGAQPEKTIRQPQKPVPPSTEPSPESPKLAATPDKSSSTKTPSISKVTVSDKEYARGKVIDPSGKALADAEITIGGAWVTHAVTDSEGKFRIEVPQLEWKPGG